MKLLGSRELCWGLESTHLLNLLVDHSPLSAMCTLDWSKCRCWSSKSSKVCQLVQVKLCGFQELIIISSWSLDWFSKKKHDDSNLNNLWVAKTQKSKISMQEQWLETLFNKVDNIRVYFLSLAITICLLTCGWHQIPIWKFRTLRSSLGIQFRVWFVGIFVCSSSKILLEVPIHVAKIKTTYFKLMKEIKKLVIIITLWVS